MPKASLQASLLNMKDARPGIEVLPCTTLDLIGSFLWSNASEDDPVLLRGRLPRVRWTWCCRTTRQHWHRSVATDTIWLAACLGHITALHRVQLRQWVRANHLRAEDDYIYSTILAEREARRAAASRQLWINLVRTWRWQLQN